MNWLNFWALIVGVPAGCLIELAFRIAEREPQNRPPRG
jgi:hypothetical protein